MFEKLVSRCSKKFLKKNDVDVAQPPTPLDWPVQVDRILEFYTDIKQRLLQKLEGLDFDPVLPESSQKVINSDQTVEGLKKSDLSQFPTKYYGIVLFKKTLEELEHRITHLSKVKADVVVSNGQELVKANQQAINNIYRDYFLTEFPRPSSVVNGYWFYTNMPSWKDSYAAYDKKICTTVYIAHNAAANVKDLPRGSFEFEANFQVDSSINCPITIANRKPRDLSSLSILGKIEGSYGYIYISPVPELLKCSHVYIYSKSWGCDQCTLKALEHEKKRLEACSVCGKYSDEFSYISCSCKSAQTQINEELKSEVELLKNELREVTRMVKELTLARTDDNGAAAVGTQPVE